MPKAKITKSPLAHATSSTNRAPVKINTGGTPLWYKIVMFGLMLAGLGWLIVNYLIGPQIPFMVALEAWNYGIGFGLFVLGLLMTMGWR